MYFTEEASEKPRLLSWEIGDGWSRAKLDDGDVIRYLANPDAKDYVICNSDGDRVGWFRVNLARELYEAPITSPDKPHLSFQN